MNKRKLSYKDARNKKQVREFLFSLFADLQLKKIVGLAGPDINDYLEFCKSKGYKEFEIWENDSVTLLKQLREIKASKAAFKYGNILDAVSQRSDVLYDLDYCVTIRHMKEHLTKFKERFIMTFARRVKDDETISTFFSTRGETIFEKLENLNPLKHTVFHTNKGMYIFINYRDTSNMCCITKIN